MCTVLREGHNTLSKIHLGVQYILNLFCWVCGADWCMHNFFLSVSLVVAVVVLEIGPVSIYRVSVLFTNALYI